MWVRRVGRHEGERNMPEEARGAAQLVLLLAWVLATFGVVGSSVALWIKITAAAIAAAVPTVLGFRVRRSSRANADAAPSRPDPVA